MARALIVQILGDARQYGAELDKAAGKTRSMGKVAGVAGLAIAGGLAYGLEKSVVAASHAQVETARLDAAFKAAGLGATNYQGAVGKAEDASRKLGFSNEDVRNSLGSLVIATGNTKNAISDLGVAENLARFKHIDLAAASKTLSMAMAGSQRAVKQLGITIPSVTLHYDALKRSGRDLTTVSGRLAEAHAKLQDKMATSAAVIAAVTEKTRGQSKAFADTAAGGLAQMHAQLGAVAENLGKALLPALVVVSGKLATFTGYLAKHSTTAKIVVIALGALAAALLVASVATSIMAAATLALDVALSPLLIPIAAVVAGIVLLGIAAYELVKHWGAVKGFFTSLWNDIRGIFDAGINFVKDHWRAFVIALATIIAGPIGLLVSYIATHWGQIKADAVKAWNAIKDAAGTIWGGIKSAIMAPLNAARNLAGNIWDGLKGAWSAAWHGLAGAVMGPINTIISWVNKLIGPIEAAIHLIEKLGSMGGSGGPAKSGGTKPGQPRGPKGGRGASGGIVTMPTWALIGESGPEALIPLSSMPGARALGRNTGGGGSPIIINVHGWVGNDQQLARHLRDQLVKIGRVEGPIFGGYA